MVIISKISTQQLALDRPHPQINKELGALAAYITELAISQESDLQVPGQQLFQALGLLAREWADG